MGRRPGTKVLVAVIILAVSSSIVAAQVSLFDVTDATSVTDPDSPEVMEWSSSGTYSTVLHNDNPGNGYLLEIHLEEYANQTGDAAVVETQEGSVNAINSLTINHSGRGVPEEIRNDLMNDGTAQYYRIPAQGEDLTITIDAGASGNLSFHRAPLIADHISVRTHREVETHECGQCHVDSSSPAVHQEQGATDFAASDWQSETCTECHGQTMTNLHQDCDSSCHYEGYPIGSAEPHSPDISSNGGLMVEGEYYCGNSTCHGASSATSSHIVQFTGSRADDYCPECHTTFATNGTVAELHSRSGFQITDYSQTSDDCMKCHGIDGDTLHNHFVGKKSRCGSGDCHTGGQGT